jgi:hypothetical protein
LSPHDRHHDLPERPQTDLDLADRFRRNIRGPLFVSQPSFKTNSKGNGDYDFEQIVWCPLIRDRIGVAETIAHWPAAVESVVKATAATMEPTPAATTMGERSGRQRDTDR